MTDITIKSKDAQDFYGYASAAPQSQRPGIVIIQEIFGVNSVMREVTDDYAADGYNSLCPDLFWRLQPRVELDDHKKADWDRAFALMNAFDLERGLADIDAAADHLRANSQKIGTVGYCLGGRLAFLMAARDSIDCAVSYYGVALTQHLGKIAEIKKPLLMHIAEQDKFMNDDDREKLVAAIGQNPNITHYIYDNVDHAFARPGGEHYDEDAAHLANERTDAFFRQHLRA